MLEALAILLSAAYIGRDQSNKENKVEGWELFMHFIETMEERRELKKNEVFSRTNQTY